MEITKQIEIDYGHIVHLHNSACKNLHGHRGKIVARLEGDLVSQNVSDNGMVMDFKHIKAIMMKNIHDVLDHSFVISSEAPQVGAILQLSEVFYGGKMRLVVLDVVPTAENLAKWCFDAINPELVDTYGTGLKLTAVEFWETPTSCAIYRLE